MRAGENMDHKLRPLIRLDLDPRSAVIEVAGCLTLGGSQALLPLIKRLGSLLRDDAHSVTVDVTHAQHIDAEGLAYLQGLQSLPPGTLPGFSARIVLRTPDTLPECPVLVLATADAGQAGKRSVSQ